MKIIFIRHGEDTLGQRGGWSDATLTETGINQVISAIPLLEKMNFDYIIASDITRAKQTAEIINESFHKPLSFSAEWREVNTGDLSGMKHELANQKYPGIYWNTLKIDEKFPGGESPIEFFNRIKTTFNNFVKNNDGRDVLIVTHSGVMNAIYCIVNKLEFTNKETPFTPKYAEIYEIEV